MLRTRTTPERVVRVYLIARIVPWISRVQFLRRPTSSLFTSQSISPPVLSPPLPPPTSPRLTTHRLPHEHQLLPPLPCLQGASPRDLLSLLRLLPRHINPSSHHLHTRHPPHQHPLPPPRASHLNLLLLSSPPPPPPLSPPPPNGLLPPPPLPSNHHTHTRWTNTETNTNPLTINHTPTRQRITQPTIPAHYPQEH